jgi:hypothetical protein
MKQTLSGRGCELFILILVLTSIVSYYYLSSNNWARALTEAFINEDLEIDTTQLSYYGSIFSNLSRGLPIDEIVPSSEPTNGQEEEDIQQVNVNSTGQQS